MSKHILIFGCGKLGQPLGLALQDAGYRVTGVARNPRDLPFPTICADITQRNSLTDLNQNYDAAVVILPPSQRSEEGYESIYEQGIANLTDHLSSLSVPPPCLFVSSSSVYGNTDGQWVDETTVPKPTSYGGKYLLMAENQITQYHSKSVVVRFSGIYGGGRNFLLRQLEAGKAVQKSPAAYTNRIHEMDCVGVLSFLVEKLVNGETLSDCYLASDDDPVDRWRLFTWLAEKMGKPAPDVAEYDANASQNKRCDNARLKALGYQFKYPTFKAGYAEMLNQKSI